MIIKNDRQLARVCRALVSPHKRPLEVDQLFTLDGPTLAAEKLFEKDGGPMSSGERIMFLTAMSLWTGAAESSPTIADAAFRLDGANLGRLAEILTLLAQPDPNEMDRYLDQLETNPNEKEKQDG